MNLLGIWSYLDSLQKFMRSILIFCSLENQTAFPHLPSKVLVIIPREQKPKNSKKNNTRNRKTF